MDTRKTLTLAALLPLALAFSGGCCRLQPEFVPVREAIFRTEVATTNRLTLPLESEAREFLLTFLKSGRNPQLDSDLTISNPEAEARYGELLALLSEEEHLSVTNLVADDRFTAGPLFREWFPGRATRQVVDAHEEWPVTPQPYAFLDGSGKYWWVFYHKRTRLTHVMVTLAHPHELER